VKNEIEPKYRAHFQASYGDYFVYSHFLERLKWEVGWRTKMRGDNFIGYETRKKNRIWIKLSEVDHSEAAE